MTLAYKDHLLEGTYDDKSVNDGFDNMFSKLLRWQQHIDNTTVKMKIVVRFLQFNIQRSFIPTDLQRALLIFNLRKTCGEAVKFCKRAQLQFIPRHNTLCSNKAISTSVTSCRNKTTVRGRHEVIAQSEHRPTHQPPFQLG